LAICNPLANDAAGYRIAGVFVLFYLQKYLEFFDTWFFILRKSSRQVTFLHLFHHSSITIVVGSILPFDYNGDMYLPILLNSANHMLVYLHYLLATLGVQSSWASYITSLQLLQFVAIFGQSLLTYRIGPTCGSPDFAKVLMIVYMGSMVVLFGNFFMQKYVFGRANTTLDLCGVIKRPRKPVKIVAQHCGTVRLNKDGKFTVFLPDDFPDANRMKARAFSHPPFTISYQVNLLKFLELAVCGRVNLRPCLYPFVSNLNCISVNTAGPANAAVAHIGRGCTICERKRTPCKVTRWR
jgi:GNS1/SUR4 family